MSKPTDIVIPLGTCSTPEANNFAVSDHQELRWCLRSIVKHLKKIGDIYIIGDRPTWLVTGNGLHYANSHDFPGITHKAKNIFNKLMQAVRLGNLSEDFLVMHDDHFLLSDFEAGQFPYYFSSTIIDALNDIKTQTAYYHTVENTFRAVGAKSLYFDLHCPMLMNKRKLLPVRLFDWGKEYGFLIKSLYCHANDIKGEHTEDVKIYAQMSPQGIALKLAGKKFFSTGENCFNEIVVNKMNELYNEKAVWEK